MYRDVLADKLYEEPQSRFKPMLNEDSPSDALSVLSQNLGKAYWAAMRITRSVHLAEEAVQEAYISFLSSPPKYVGDIQMRNCFLIKVRLTARNLLRGERRLRRREERYSKTVPVLDDSSESVLGATEMAQSARMAMNSLPLDEREAISLCYEQGFTREEAAEIMTMSKPKLMLLVNRGLARLRKILSDQGYESLSPAVVTAALSSLPLPAVPATLTAALQNIASNPALAAAKAAKLSAKALSQTAVKKTAVWLAFGLFAGAAAIAGGIWYWSNLPQNSSAVSKTETAAPTPTDSDVEIIYEDDFDGETLSDFWEKVEPAGQVTVNDKEYKSALVLRIAGPKAKAKLLPKAAATSRCIDLAQGVLEIVVKNGEANLFSHKGGTDAESDGVSLCDENWNTATAFAHAGNKLGFAMMKEKLNAVDGDRMPSAERRHYLFPSGDVLIFGVGNRFFGYMEPKPQRVRLQLYAQISDPSAYGAYCFDRVSVRVLQQLPEDIAREYADAVAKRREAEAAEKR